MQQEVEYLRFFLTSNGVKPQPKKVEATKKFKPPTNSKQLKRFLVWLISIETFGRDVLIYWRLSTNYPLRLKIKLAMGWNKIESLHRSKSNALQIHNISLSEFCQAFDLYTDTSNLQLGATLGQYGKPIDFCIRRSTQHS